MPAPISIAEHWDVLWYVLIGIIVLVSALIGFINTLIWRFVVKPLQSSLEKVGTSIDDLGKQFQTFVKGCGECRLELEERYAKDEDLKDWKKGRNDLKNELYGAIDHHSHAGLKGDDGRVTR